jgi:hypothetical protein
VRHPTQRPRNAIVLADYDPAWPAVIEAVDEAILGAVHVMHTGFAVAAN